MTWFVGVAAASVLAFARSGAAGSRRYWLACVIALGAFAVALGRYSLEHCPCITAPPVILLAMFILTTLVMGVGAAYHRVPASTLVAFACSDIALGLALYNYHAFSAEWALPARQAWGSGAFLAAVAAVLRLGATAFTIEQTPVKPTERPPKSADDTSPSPQAATSPREALSEALSRGERDASQTSAMSNAALALRRALWPAPSPLPVDGTLACVGWWQGALLAWWVAGSAVLALGAGGLAVLLAFAWRGRSRLSALSAAGGVITIAAAAGTSRNAVMAIGLIGVAFVLGERLVGVWGVAVLPLSVLTQQKVPAGIWMAAPAAVFPIGWAAMGCRLGSHVEASRAGRLLAAAGLALSLGAMGSTIQAGAWIVYGAIIAAVITFGLTRSVAELPGQHVFPEVKAQRLGSGRLIWVGWALVVVAVAIAGKLVLTGLETGFI